MAARKKSEKVYIVTVEKNPNFCGEGAGGAQFAHGKAQITSDRLANWFREHDGYKVTETVIAAEQEAETGE